MEQHMSRQGTPAALTGPLPCAECTTFPLTVTGTQVTQSDIPTFGHFMCSHSATLRVGISPEQQPVVPMNFQAGETEAGHVTVT